MVNLLEMFPCVNKDGALVRVNAWKWILVNFV